MVPEMYCLDPYKSNEGIFRVDEHPIVPVKKVGFVGHKHP